MIEPVARLKITLADIQPAIWRRVDMPLSANFRALHDVIQAAFGWENRHLFEFRLGGKVYGEPTPDDALFGKKVSRARNLRLAMVIERGVDRFDYVYDFGDDWCHEVVIESIFQGDPETDYPMFVDAARLAPPEDIGGPPGFAEFVEAMADPAHAQHADLLRWHGEVFDPEALDRRRIEVEIATIAEFRRRALEGHRSRRRNAAD